MNIQTPFLYPILDEARSTDLERDAQELIRAGARILQLRCKKMNNAGFFRIVTNLVAICKRNGVLLILNDRVDVCMITEASGVHLGQDDFPVAEARQLLPQAIVGVSTHNINQFKAADRLPVDYISIGPIFQTTSKANSDPVVGLDLLRNARTLTSKPIVCIGGITGNQIPELLEAGADGIAVISEIYRNNDVFNNAQRLIRLFSPQRHKDTS